MNDLDLLERQLGPGLRRVLDDVLSDGPIDIRVAAAPPTTSPESEEFAELVTVIPHRRVRSGRHKLAAAAAIALLAGTAGAALVKSQPSTHVSFNESGGTGTSQSDPMSKAASASAKTPIFLPEAAPAGFTLTDLNVGMFTATSLESRPTTTRYLRRDVSGAITSQLTIAASKTSADDVAKFEGSLTVHGLPASIYDSGEGPSVAWLESGFYIDVHGNGLSRSEAIAIAEATVVDVDVQMASLAEPGSFNLEPLAELSTLRDAPTANVQYLNDQRAPGVFISFDASPSDGETLEWKEASLHAKGTRTVDRTNVDGISALIITPPADQFGQLNTLIWIRDGYELNLTGRVPEADLLAFARTVKLATVADARQLDTTIQAARHATPEIDRATLPNGFVISIRGSGNGPDTVCLEQPIVRCNLLVSESSLIGEAQDVLITSMRVDGVEWILGWARGQHQPHLVGESGSDAGPITDVAAGASGTFLATSSALPGAPIQLDRGSTQFYGSTIAPGVDLLNP